MTTHSSVLVEYALPMKKWIQRKFHKYCDEKERERAILHNIK